MIPHLYFMQLQLQQLLETLSHTEPHYIRCVKPNNVLKPAIFENKNVLQQLRCGVRGCYVQMSFFFLFIFPIMLSKFPFCMILIQGVMEAIRISCAGYPTRKPFAEFVDRFGLLAPEVLDGR